MTSARVSCFALLLAGLAAVAAGHGATSAVAQDRPVILAQQDQDDEGDQAPPQRPQGQVQDFGGDQGGTDPSALLLRVGRLENEIRTMRGRMEELQHQNDQLQESLRKLSQDVDFRFQDLQHGNGAGGAPIPQKRVDSQPGVATPAAPAVAVADGTAPAGRPAPLRQTQSGDAFDPNADPAAPGAPRQLGTTPPSQPLGAADQPGRPVRQASNAPLDLMHSRNRQDSGGDADGGPNVIDAPDPARAITGPNSVASLAPGGTREEFEADLGFYKQGQYDAAASGLVNFVQKYPRDRLVPDAIYLAGESYSKLGRHREAAEQYLKLSTDYAKAPRAPDALLRLGMSLDALGAKDQACATFQEVNRKYPTASADVKSSVDRELKRARCQG